MLSHGSIPCVSCDSIPHVSHSSIPRVFPSRHRPCFLLWQHSLCFPWQHPSCFPITASLELSYGSIPRAFPVQHPLCSHCDMPHASPLQHPGVSHAGICGVSSSCSLQSWCVHTGLRVPWKLPLLGCGVSLAVSHARWGGHWLPWSFGPPSLLDVSVLCPLRVLGAWSGSAWGIPLSG